MIRFIVHMIQTLGYSPALELLSGLICVSTPFASRNPIGRILLPFQVTMCSSEIALGRCLLQTRKRMS